MSVASVVSMAKITPNKCTAARVALSASSAAVLAGFDERSVGIWTSSPYDDDIQGRFFPGVSTVLDPAMGQGDPISCLCLEDPTLSTLEEHPTLCSASHGVKFAAGTIYGSVLLYELSVLTGTLRCLDNFRAHSIVPGAAARRNGVSALGAAAGALATGGADGSFSLWTIAGERSCEETEDGREGSGGTQARSIPGAHGGALTAAAVARSRAIPSAYFREGSVVAATGGDDGVVKIWCEDRDVVMGPTHGGSRPSKQKEPQNHAITDLDFDLPNLRLCTGAEDCFVRVYDLSVNRPTRVFQHRGKRLKAGSLPEAGPLSVQAVAFDAAEAQTQLASAGTDGSLQVWDIRQSDNRPVVNLQHAHCGAISSVALRGERLLSASASEGRAALWDIRHLSETTAASLWEIRMFGARNPAPEKPETACLLCCADCGTCLPGAAKLHVTNEPHEDLIIPRRDMSPTAKRI